MPQVAGKSVGDVGLGMIPLTPHTDPTMSETQAFSVLKAAIESGSTLWDGAEIYGKPDYNSLILLNRYFAKYPEDADKVVLNIKGASLPTLMPNGEPKFVRQSIENCVRQLGDKARIDIFEMARIDVAVPLEDSLQAIVNFVDEGKIGGVGLSEVSASTIRRAAKITKILAVEVELSLWVREPLTNGITEACHELDIPIMAYCPLGRGMLSSKLKTPSDIPGFLRAMFPRYQQGNFDQNLKLVEELERVAARKGCSMAQLALGWLKALSMRDGMPAIIPIPGTSNPGRVEENANAAPLSGDEMLQIDAVLSEFQVAGARYPEPFMALTNL